MLLSMTRPWISKPSRNSADSDQGILCLSTRRYSYLQRLGRMSRGGDIPSKSYAHKWNGPRSVCSTCDSESFETALTVWLALCAHSTMRAHGRYRESRTANAAAASAGRNRQVSHDRPNRSRAVGPRPLLELA